MKRRDFLKLGGALTIAPMVLAKIAMPKTPVKGGISLKSSSQHRVEVDDGVWVDLNDIPQEEHRWWHYEQLLVRRAFEEQIEVMRSRGMDDGILFYVTPNGRKIKSIDSLLLSNLDKTYFKLLKCKEDSSDWQSQLPFLEKICEKKEGRFVNLQTDYVNLGVRRSARMEIKNET
jgi:hypothetical protein